MISKYSGIVFRPLLSSGEGDPFTDEVWTGLDLLFVLPPQGQSDEVFCPELIDVSCDYPCPVVISKNYQVFSRLFSVRPSIFTGRLFY